MSRYFTFGKSKYQLALPNGFGLIPILGGLLLGMLVMAKIYNTWPELEQIDLLIYLMLFTISMFFIPFKYVGEQNG